MYSISSAVSADSLSASSEPGCEPSHSSSQMMLVSHTSPADGRAFRCLGTLRHCPSNPDFVTCSAVDSPVSPLARHHADESEPSTSGLSSTESSTRRTLLGLSLRTSLALAMEASSGCAVLLRTKTILSGRLIQTLRYQRDSVADIASSGWPTPTTRYTHDSPSMRKWPAFANYQSHVGRTTPRLWEWMMCFPDGWTASSSLETRSRRTSPSSSAEQSCSSPS